MATLSSGSDGQTKEWAEIYEEIKKDYEEAYACIDKAIKLDEDGKMTEALSNYEFGLSLIDKALGAPLECPSNPDITWEKTYVMIQKMKKTRKEVIIRMEEAQSKPHVESVAPPPSYEEAMAASPISATNNSNMDHQIPGSSKVNVPYIPPSAVYDANLVEGISSPSNKENTHLPPTYSELCGQLGEMKISNTNWEIIYNHDNVRLYFIAPDGRVSATSEPDTLIIGRIEDATCSVLDETLINIVNQINADQGRKKRHHHRRHHIHRRRHRHHKDKKSRPDEQGIRKSVQAADPEAIEIPLQDVVLEPDQPTGQVFLQVGSWIYPLIPEVSPCFRSEYGAFILPDINSGIEGAAVGLILPEDADESVYQLLSEILNGEAGADAFKESGHHRSRRSRRAPQATDSVTPTAYSAASSSFSQNLIKGASYLANNLVRGAGSTARFIDVTTPRIIDKINPTPEPQPINPTVKKSMEVAKNVTGKAADVTDYLATKIRGATSALGRYLAPQVQKTGTRLLTSTTKMSEEEASQKINTVLDVTSGAVEGIATVYSGLETAAGILGRSLSNNTVQIIEYKYGTSAGSVTNDAFSTIGSAYYVHHNVKMFKPKGLAKAAAKGAGSAVLEDYRASVQKPHEEFQGPGPGDGSGFLPPKKS